MGSPILAEFKRQASFYLKEKIKTARLALTDVTPAQLLAEEATSENVWPPDTRSMGVISRAAFEVDDYCRIVEIVHDRLINFDGESWRIYYKTLLLLEHLLTHGPLRVAEEFERQRHVIRKIGFSFSVIDENGFNWGLTLANLSLKVIKLIEDGEFLMEERTRKRRLMRGIQGFGRRFNNEHPSTSSSSSSDTEDGSPSRKPWRNSSYDLSQERAHSPAELSADDLDSDDGSQSQSPDSTGAGILLKAITRWNSSCDLPKLRLHSYTELPQDEPSAEDEEHEGFPTIEGDHPLLVNSDIQP
ncbi:unnamed protein product [Linum tenue]|uniref:ENTH domain-containing protein n=1 Tax=Linum tenue TaxID=586396 RepID=A0AAV0MAZ7_9ROSI|nr:unnamed protein product [Linum tenue]